MSRRTTWALAAILVVLLAGSYVASRLAPPPATPSTPPAPAWLELTNDQIRSISILDVAAGQRLQVDRSATDAWTLQTPPAGPADAQKLKDWLAQWQAVRPSRTLTPTAGLDEFGLGQPALVVTFTAQSGAATVIRVGKRAPAAGGYYAQRAGDRTIAVIETVPVDETQRMVGTPPLAPTALPAASPVVSGTLTP